MTTNPATCDCPKGDLDMSPGMCRCGEIDLYDGAVTFTEANGTKHSKYICYLQSYDLPEECEAMRTDEK